MISGRSAPDQSFLARLAVVVFAIAVLAALAIATSVPVSAQHAPAAQPSPAAHEAEPGQEAHEGGWLPTVAKAVNFAILAGVLVYFLKTPLTEYLSSRITKVRQDLVTAAETREAATRQLAEIQARLEALPRELEDLKARGAEEITAERERIRQAAGAERERLLEHARREIDMRLRIARRELVEHAAGLAVAVASERIKRSITSDDQARLLERYASQLKEVRA
ncbi:MAG: hypothetical protein HOQ29_08400 [Acidobacteria bacterium]|nr:hypothetical protein [Acidobacteriota bacterium]